MLENSWPITINRTDLTRGLNLLVTRLINPIVYVALKLACASGRQSVILVSHTRIESSIYILLTVSLLASLLACGGGGILGASTNSRVGTAMSTISVPMFAINGAEGRASSIGWIEG
jgi:hypothetical protein